MGMAARDKKAKKAGPKGKRARKQAKLDNRWGETVDPDEVRKTTRRGANAQKALRGEINKRLAERSNESLEGFYLRVSKAKNERAIRAYDLKQEYQAEMTAAAKPKRNVVEHDESSSSSDSDSSDSDHDNDEAMEGASDDEGAEMGPQNPMGGLLDMIRSKTTYKNSTSDEEEEGSDESENDSSDSDSDEEMVTDDDESSEHSADETDPSGNSTEHLTTTTDVFRKRFGRPPLDASEVSRLEEAQKPTVKKIACGKHTELQYTLPPLEETTTSSGNGTEGTNDNQCASDDTTMCGELLANETPEAWQTSARETYANGTREALQKHWTVAKSGKKASHPSNGSFPVFSDAQAPVYSFLARYADVLDATSGTGKGNDRSKTDRQTQKDQHRLHTLHVLNHVLTSRARIGRNNRYLKEREAQQEAEAAAKEEENSETKAKKKHQREPLPSRSLANAVNVGEERDVRDQGFTRPTVLVLLPTRTTCHRFVKDLYKLSGAPIDPEQEDRFDADYGELLEDDDDEEPAGENPQKEAAKKARRQAVLESKGREWNEYFGDTANQDDDFKIGISLIPKTVTKGGGKSSGSNVSIRLYSDFFRSDIIVASPLGLKMILTPEGGGDNEGSDDEDSEDGGNRKGNIDYLSSIEICLLQHSEMILMQNWDHVNEILSLLNQDPVHNNGTDFSRVRNYLLESQGARWRQLILSSKFWDPAILSTFKRFGKSLSGQVKVRRKIRDGDASISRVLVPIKQVFQKVPTGTFAQQSKARVDYFVKTLWPQIQKNDQKHTLVFVPSYFDFCSLRNALLKLDQKHLFVSVTEYSRGTEIGRGRARFLQGRKPLMLYTGRAHFFHRHAIKGVHHLVMLGLPEHPEFYADCVNQIQTTAPDDEGQSHRETSCLALFTKYEAHALERIVGSSNASRMASSPNSAFIFQS